MSNEKELTKALGKLAKLHADASVAEIMVDAPDKVYVERDGVIEDTTVKFDSEEELVETINALLAFGGRHLDAQNTYGDVQLPDGCRMLGVVSPTAVNGPYLVIRKPTPDPLSMADILNFGAISQEAADFLTQAVQKRANTLVSGGTGSGKTTVLHILAEAFPEDERIIVVEQFQELRLRNPRVVNLPAERSPDLSYTDLVIVAARMRPDRLVFGEFHGSEALHALQLMATGHDGSLASIHGNSPQNALARLETMCLMANLGIGLYEIRSAIADAIHLITHQERRPDGSRRIINVVELQGLDHDRYILQPIFAYNEEKDVLQRVGKSKSFD